jgi:hypothetical protein
MSRPTARRQDNSPTRISEEEARSPATRDREIGSNQTTTLVALTKVRKTAPDLRDAP